MSVFADSSAVVKLYAEEAGSQDIRKLQGIVVSALARVEVPAAIWRKVRMGELSSEDAADLVSAFEADYYGDDSAAARFVAAKVTSSILDDAASLAATVGLRAYEAVQLATAQAVAAADPSCRVLAAYDQQLRVAAAAAGFDLVPSVASEGEGTSS